MKTYMKSFIAGMITFLLGFGLMAGVYALSDEEFRSAVMAQIESEIDLSSQELDEIRQELENITFTDITEHVGEEISMLEDGAFKDEVQSDYEVLKNIQEGDSFMQGLDTIYEKLDDHYSKQEVHTMGIIVSQNSDMNDVTMDSSAIVSNDTILGEAIEIKDFATMKDMIIESLEQEKKYVDNSDIQEQIGTVIQNLRQVQEEEVFFGILDKFYESEIMNDYYKDQGVELVSMGAFVAGEFDFETERTFIIEELEREVTMITDAERQKKIQQELVLLKNTDSEEIFFKKLEDIYMELDTYFGVSSFWIDEKELEGMSEQEIQEYLGQNYGEAVEVEFGEILGDTKFVDIQDMNEVYVEEK